MSLEAWEELFQPSFRSVAGGRYVPISAGDPGYRHLWHLSDYYVSSVVAGSVYLCRR